MPVCDFCGADSFMMVEDFDTGLINKHDGSKVIVPQVNYNKCTDCGCSILTAKECHRIDEHCVAAGHEPDVAK